jgi:hypothetical protein
MRASSIAIGRLRLRSRKGKVDQFEEQSQQWFEQGSPCPSEVADLLRDFSEAHPLIEYLDWCKGEEVIFLKSRWGEYAPHWDFPKGTQLRTDLDELKGKLDSLTCFIHPYWIYGYKSHVSARTAIDGPLPPDDDPRQVRDQVRDGSGSG